MYKFAYLYVRLGYVLAGAVLTIALLFIGGAIIMLELQKPKISAADFNREFAEIQRNIQAQADAIQHVFQLDQSLPALRSLKSRKWDVASITPRSAKRLEREYDATSAEIASLRQLLLAQLQEDVDFIIGKLAPNDEVAAVKADGTPAPQNFQDLTGKPTLAQGIYANHIFSQRVAMCNDALNYVASLLAEAKSTDNRAALGRAKNEVLRFLEIIREQRTMLEYSEIQEAADDQQTVRADQKEEPKPSRRDNVREDLVNMLNEVQVAVTGGWSLDQSVVALHEKLKDFKQQAYQNGRISANLFNTQLGLFGVLLLIVVLAFFIAVGSDLVKAILDSAVWLSHIYTNTAVGTSSEDDPNLFS